jgi:stringent starvation protein B
VSAIALHVAVSVSVGEFEAFHGIKRADYSIALARRFFGDAHALLLPIAQSLAIRARIGLRAYLWS